MASSTESAMVLYTPIVEPTCSASMRLTESIHISFQVGNNLTIHSPLLNLANSTFAFESVTTQLLSPAIFIPILLTVVVAIGFVKAAAIIQACQQHPPSEDPNTITVQTF